MISINYQASLTGSKLHASEKVVRGYKGPVGNGKSVTCICEALRMSYDQWPNSAGIRKSRGVIVRNTGPELRTTTLKTWKQWVPEEIAPVVLSPVLTCTLVQPLPDGTTIEMEVFFLAMDRDKDVRKLLSLETTWVFLNEARELPYSVVKAARERVGRYPSKVDGYVDIDDYKAPRDSEGNIQPCKRKSVLMDTNPPDEDHWWYQLAVKGCLDKSKDKHIAKTETARIYDFFDGPSPLIKTGKGYEPNPKAENIENLPGGFQYYLDMIGGNTEDHINVMVLGNYGTILEGRPVYPDYNDSLHCPKENVRAIKGLGIGLGWDFGLTPSCIIGQLTPEGIARVVAELTTDDMDVRRFARDVVKPFLFKYFKDYEVEFSYGDPAGNNRGEGEGKSSIRILNDDYEEDEKLDLGFITEPAPTNDPTLRIDAVTKYLIRLVGGEPAYQLNNVCKSLRKGKQGAYKYRRLAVAGSEEVYKDKPDKNKYSHPADAEQYLFLGFEAVMSDSYDYEDDYVEYEEPSAMGY